MRYLIENFFLRFSKSSYGKGSYGISDRNLFLRDFLRVHIGRVRMGYLIEDFFFNRFPKIRIGYFNK
jgi:hypothetical protein